MYITKKRKNKLEWYCIYSILQRVPTYIGYPHLNKTYGIGTTLQT